MLDLTNPKHAHVDERLRTNRILWDGKHILIFSQPTSQKIRNVQHNPHVTLGLDETRGGEDMVILEGKAELLHDPAVNPTLPAFAAK